MVGLPLMVHIAQAVMPCRLGAWAGRQAVLPLLCKMQHADGRQAGLSLPCPPCHCLAHKNSMPKCCCSLRLADMLFAPKIGQPSRKLLSLLA